jgi:phosphoglycerate dehydrogenase-like enzyme
VIAWVFDAERFGAPPEGVTLATELGPDVVFAVPDDPLPDPSALRSLEVVQVVSAGVDWIVDRLPPGVTLCDARGARDGAMAEWVLAAILADAKELARCVHAQDEHRFERFEPRDVAGGHVVILGHGSIGRACARVLELLGASVTGVARHARADARALDELGALLPRADVLVNLLPLTPATRGLVDAGVLAALPDGALYVSAGRGATTDTEALVTELRRGRLRAVLDVVEPEPLPGEHPLWDLSGLLLSPHVAGDTAAADRAALALAREQMRRHAAGEPLENVVSDGY